MAARDLVIKLAVTGTQQSSREIRQFSGTTKRSFGEIELSSKSLGRALGTARTALAGLGIGFGVAGIVRGLNSIVDAGANFQKQQLQLQAVIKQTGSAAGRSFADIDALAKRIGEATLASTSEVRDAAAQLLTFRSVAGETFDRTLTLAQDLASLGFGSLTSATTQLGKALEDPARGLTSLRRVGVSFTQAQEDLIDSLVETGRQAEAQRLILDNLEAQVGGAASGQASGLAGAYDTLNERLGVFMENIGNSGLVDAFTAAVGRMSDVVAGLNNELFPGFDDQIAEMNDQIVESQEQIAELEAFLLDARDRGNAERAGFFEDAIANERANLEALKQESQALFRAEQDRKAAAEEAKKAGEAAAAALAGQATGTGELTDAEKERLKAIEDLKKAQTDLLIAQDAGLVKSFERAAQEEETVEKALEALAAETELLKLQLDGQEALIPLLEAEKRLRDQLGGRQLTDDERAALEDQVRQREKLKGALEDIADANRRAEKAADEAAQASAAPWIAPAAAIVEEIAP